MMTIDIATQNILDALDLLRYPLRLAATLRSRRSGNGRQTSLSMEPRRLWVAMFH